MKKYGLSNTSIYLLILTIVIASCDDKKTSSIRKTESFNEGWYFKLTGDLTMQTSSIIDSTWVKLNLPHDWSIEGKFSEKHPAGTGGGALPGGIGIYKKTFKIPVADSIKEIFLHFDGVYCNSEVYLNGNLLGKRPNGYISFRYNLNPYLHYGDNENILIVKVDNSKQPNSRWYSGSGIYRNVRLIKTNKIHIDLWGTYITTPHITEESAEVMVSTSVKNGTNQDTTISLTTKIKDAGNKLVSIEIASLNIKANSVNTIQQTLKLKKPIRWTLENPYLYKTVSKIKANDKTIDKYYTNFGVRNFKFDADKGFYLNGEPTKILGVCNHHDLGCLGTAVNARAIERQLVILKEMGCNGIRTAHNPPAPELLDLCDKMGFIVMDEAFDMWARKKTTYDYAQYWDEWHEIDLRDQILRDRNHPSIFIWSIGNEVIEQWFPSDTMGTYLTRKLTNIAKTLDPSRVVTAACNGTSSTNPLIKAYATDLIGYNYAEEKYKDIPDTFPGRKFIATETTSGLMTRGCYDMPSDSIRRWPAAWDKPFLDGNADHTVSAYDNVSAPWGSTHEETWREVKRYDYISGFYIWTGWDYLGEPTPYSWPSRSSYFGIIDLAGFPKDVYYMYQSEWTNKEVLHVFPHWNWEVGQEIDVKIYTNCTQVELFINENSLGTKTKSDSVFHLMWRTNYVPGTVKAIGKTKTGAEIINEVKTAGEPAKIKLIADREIIQADGYDLSFITVHILDSNNVIVPGANNLVNFTVNGEGTIAGVDNGHQTSHEPFQANYRKAFNGKCLLVVKSTNTSGEINIIAESDGLQSSQIHIKTN